VTVARHELPDGVTMLLAHPCGCGKGCAQGRKQNRCVHHWARRTLMKARFCRHCDAITWHADEKCIRCKAKKRRR